MTTSADPLRILLVMEEERFGGAELAFFNLCQALVSRCELHVALSEVSLRNGTLRAHCETLSLGQDRVHRCRHRLNPGTLANLHPRLRHAPALELARLLGRLSCDHILANLPTVERAQTVLDAAEAVSPRVPVWGYVHLSQPPSVIGAKLGFLRDRLVPSWLRRFDHLLAVSRAGARELSQRYGLPQPDVMYPPTPALSPLLPADRSRLRVGLGMGHGFLLGVIGRVQFHHKGQDAAIRLTARLVAEGKAVHLVVVGDGPDMPVLQRQVESLAVSSHVSVLGWREDLPALMPMFDAVLLPSRYEGMPQTALQAATAGVPVVGYDVDGLGELLPDEFKVAYGDEQGLLKAVTALMQKTITWPQAEIAERAASWGNPARAADHLMQLFRSASVYPSRPKQELKL